jgi:DNA polymerase III delta prime subunit
MRVKTEGGGAQNIDDTLKIQKAINDLEAHINTSIITEKSVRKAADRQLAEELD